MLSESAVRGLLRRRGTPVVVSLYLDVDGHRYPRPSDYVRRLDRLFREARDVAGRLGVAPAVIDADLAAVSDWLARGLDRSSTKGVAVFSASTAGLFEAFTLTMPVRDQVVVAPGADVAQLVGVLQEGSSVLVVAVDHQTSRLVRLEPDGVVREVDAPLDELERRVDTDAEVANLEHRHEEHVRQHLRRVARATTDELRQHGDARLVLSGTHEVTAQLESSLAKVVARRVVGRVALGPDSPPRELAGAARPVVEAARRAERLALMKETSERAAEGAGAVVGLPATLHALNGGQVETLVVDPFFVAPGSRCHTCAGLVAGDGPCPRCGAGVTPVPDVIDAAINEAFVRHVALELCPDEEAEELGHIGALVRRSVQTTTSGGRDA